VSFPSPFPLHCSLPDTPPHTFMSHYHHHHHHFRSRFHKWMTTCDISSFESGLFSLTWSPVPCIFPQTT
jgi:hypothetical protein